MNRLRQMFGAAKPVQPETPVAAPPVVAAPAPAAPPVVVKTPTVPAPAPAQAQALPAQERANWLGRLKAGLRKTGNNISTVFTGTKIDEALYEELEDALLMADTGVK
ncbi:MAG: signal recognition particle receptor subunit alpha, partial [Comamonas sp.]